MTRDTRFAVHTLGCKVNQVEGEAIAETAVRLGVEPVEDTRRANVIVLNTCSVTRTADLEAGQMARRFRRENPGAVIVVTGCYAQTRPAEAARLPVDYVIGHGGKDTLAREIPILAARGCLGTPEVRVTKILRDRRFPEFLLSDVPVTPRTRRFVKVQDGCDVFCSFCIVPQARGLPRSAGAEAILGEIHARVSEGTREIVLTGPHIGSWGRDLDPPARLADLLSLVRRGSGLSRVRVSSMEPSEFDEEVIREITDHPDVFCDHFHIPVQSGSDEVLRRMRRPHDVARYRALLERLARALGDVGLGTDVIAGFPGETQAQFRETLALLEDLPISFFHIFPFSLRSGTPAAKYPGQVATEVIRERAARLRDLGRRKANAFRERFVGRTLEVLLETPIPHASPEAGKEQRREIVMRGYSRNYIAVEARGTHLRTNEVRRVRIEAVSEDGNGAVRGRVLP